MTISSSAQDENGFNLNVFTLRRLVGADQRRMLFGAELRSVRV